MSAELLALLDGLEAAREKATPGEFYVARRRHIFTDATSRPGIGETFMPADAALIVAAVNNLPKLTAALRAVLAAADEWETTGAGTGVPAIRRTVVVNVLRGVIADALTPEQADR